MKISLNWLNDYVKIDRPADQIAEILSDAGLPNEGIEHLDGDAVIDLEITSNRGDCLSHIGVARELAAATGADLKPPAVCLIESQKSAADLVGVEIISPNLCGRYVARIIEGVKVGLSPDWMVKRLEAVGLRSVNNVVDATNYAMMETGQPPHAFDYEKIHSGKIIVRNAKAGETIVSIDGTKCELSSDMLVIADPKGPVAIGGVMGGLHTEVTNDTKTILLEQACFDSVSIRKTSRALNLPSEAAFRFERIVDVENVEWASKRTAQLIVQVAGGRVAKGLVDVWPEKPTQKKVTLRLQRLRKLIGCDVPLNNLLKILSALSFQPVQQGDIVICTIPSWRKNDVCREIDLIEEVARVYGYDKVPVEQKISIAVAPADSRQKLANLIAAHLNGCGFYEAVTTSFVDDSVASLFVPVLPASHLAVRAQVGTGPNLLRRTLIGSLLQVLKTNLYVKNRPCRIYEIANTFSPLDENSLPVEKTALAIACDCDFRELKGVVESLMQKINPCKKKGCSLTFVPADLVWASAAAKILLNDAEIGTIGIPGQNIKEKFDFKDITICAAEIDFEKLIFLHKAEIKFKPLPKYPEIERDLSVVVDETVSWAQIAAAVNSKSPAELEQLMFVDLYQGKGIPAGKKSITLSLRFRDQDGTLTHEAVDRFQADILTELTKAAGAQLRTI